MPEAIEERLATLEAQVQGLAEHLARSVHGFGTAYSLEWCLIDDEEEPGWHPVYDWKLDPTHPLHAKAASVDA